jgi:hypothetical protein
VGHEPSAIQDFGQRRLVQRQTVRGVRDPKVDPCVNRFPALNEPQNGHESGNKERGIRLSLCMPFDQADSPLGKQVGGVGVPVIGCVVHANSAPQQCAAPRTDAAVKKKRAF